MPIRTSQLAALVFLASITSALSNAQVNEANFKKLDTLFNERITKKSSPSYALAVVEKGHIVYARGYGMANLEDNIEATASTVYRLGSITKQFTATMIMQLVQEGKLKIDEPFETILPEMPKAWEKVTVKNLLNHTSGIKSYTELNGLFDGDAMKPTTPAGIVKTVEKEPIDFEPGTKWHYNNTGYELLGMIIEKLDKRTYAESLKARITTPLGMDHTYFVSESKVIPRRAQGYSWNKTAFEHAHYLNMDWPYAAGSIESTVLDLAKWDEALYGEKILPHKVLEQMWTTTKLTDGTVAKYGYGWELDTMNGSPIVHHGGGIHGFTTEIRRSPTRSITVIVLSNSDGASNPAALAAETMGIMDPSLKKAEIKTEGDKDPAKTKHDQEILQTVLDGKFDRSALSDGFAKQLTPELLDTAKTQLATLGKITKFVFVNERDVEADHARNYKVTFEHAEMTFTLVVDKGGKITGMTIHQ